MKIAVVGGGFTGMVAAFFLAKNGHAVTVFEKEKMLGGLASGFKPPHWDWSLEKTYHHLFSNDTDVLNFAKELGFKDIFFSSPQTASLYQTTNYKLPTTNIYRIIPVDTPQDFLSFPFLNLVNKFRAGLVVAFLKLSPFLKFYEKNTSEKFLKKTMGERVWYILWQELFRKKFGDFAGNILASFIWARIKKRTKDLGYIKGGFQALINYIQKQLLSLGVNILTNSNVVQIIKNRERFRVICPESLLDFDAVISTLATPILIKLAADIFPKKYLQQLAKVKYLHAVNLILETEKSLLDKTYWLNVCVPNIPIMGLVQHTNFIDKKHYDDKHILYIANYAGDNDKLLKMSKEELLNHYLPHLRKINSNFQFPISKQISNFKQQTSNFYIYKSTNSQPIFDADFIKNKPEFITPAKNFYIANLDMTYPYDRGVNFAVKVGKEVAGLVNKTS